MTRMGVCVATKTECSVTIQNDSQIRDLIQRGMMEYAETSGKVRHDGVHPVISYGISSYGYDIRLGRDVKVFVPMPGRIINPKRFDPFVLVEPIIQHDADGEWFELPPHSFMLGVTVEYIRVPQNVLCICLGKSTYARCGLILNTTPFEPGWEGHVTLELSNTTPLPAKIFINEGIGQVIFLQGDPPEQGYGQGKYQHQGAQITLPKV